MDPAGALPVRISGVAEPKLDTGCGEDLFESGATRADAQPGWAVLGLAVVWALVSRPAAHRRLGVPKGRCCASIGRELRPKSQAGY
jgi:hypothetical protein